MNLHAFSLISICLFLLTDNVAAQDATVGTLGGDLTVANGTANYSVPIEVAPGRGGMQPELSLHYSDAGGNGVLGMGWGLGGLSAISRCAATIAQDGFWGGISFGARDRYCLDGQRLVPIEGDSGEVGTEYRTEIDSYSQIIAYGGSDYNPDYWVVKTKAGQVLIYGGGGNASQTLPQGTSSWLLRSLNDTTGNNPVTYQYVVDQNIHYLDEVSYSGGRVEMVYSDARADAAASFFRGQTLVMKKRLQQINTYSPSTLLKTYRVTYEGGDTVTTPSKLTAITVCDAQNNCLPATSFGWSDAGDGSLGGMFKRSTKTGGYGLAGLYDVDGDGYLDAVWQKRTKSLIAMRVALNQRDGTFRQTTYSRVANGNYSRWSFSGMYDVNGDGLVDAVWLNSPVRGPSLAVSLAQGDGRYGSIITQASNVDNERTWKVAGMHDVNSDGLPDAIWQYQHKDEGLRIATRLAQGDGSFSDLIETVVAESGDYSTWSFAGMEDTDGDGAKDAVWVYRGVNEKGKLVEEGTRVGVSLSQNNGSFGDLINTHTTENGDYSKWSFAGLYDTNSDGLPDAIWRKVGSFATSFSLGNGRYGDLLVDTHGAIKGHFVGMQDVNGDGLADGLWVSGRATWKNSVKIYTRLAMGDGRYRPVVTSRNLGRGHLSASGRSSFVGTYDLNNDGLPDMFWELKAYDDDENKYDPPRAISYSLGIGGGSYGPIRSRSANKHSSFRGLYDVNNDGSNDVVWTRSEDIDVRHSNSRVSRITYIVDGQGKRTSLIYYPLSNRAIYTKDNDAEYPLIDQIGSQHVVGSVKTDYGVDRYGRTLQKKTLYHYKGLKHHVLGRGSYGYASITESHAFATGSGYSVNNRLNLTFDQRDFPYTGSLSSEEEQYRHGRDFQRATLKRDTTEALETFPGVYQLNLTRSEKHHYELGSTEAFKRTVTLRRGIDRYGNVERTDVVNFAGDNAFSTILINNYQNDESRWHLGRVLTSETIYNSPDAPDERRIKNYSYDSATGLRLSETLTGSQTGETLTATHNTYNRYGQVTRKEMHSPNDGVRYITYAYTSTGRLAETCNVYNECESHNYTPEGWLATSTGPNGIATTWDYDGFGRKVAENRADGTRTQTDRYLAGSGWCGDVADGAYHCTLSQTSGDQPVITQYDALDRVVRTINVGFDGRLIFRDTTYNNRGLVDRISRDYYQGDHRVWAQTHYDALGRATHMSEPGPQGTASEVLTEYHGLRTTVRRGPDALTTTIFNNALDQKVRVEEEEGSTIEYTYNSDGNLLTTRVNGDPATTITLNYDEFGRKVGMDDPDMGQWQYTYNAFGELIRQADAKGQTMTMEYDLLGRMVKRTEPEGVSTWTYGDSRSPQGSIGKLLQEKARGITKDYAYDNLGRSIATTTRIADVGSFTARTGYDAYGRVERVQYPGAERFSITNIYNSNGFLSAVAGDRSQAEPHDYAQLAPLVSEAITLAEEYVTQSVNLRVLGEYYQAQATHYQALVGDGQIDSILSENLAIHQDLLSAVISQGESEPRSFLGHLNNTIDKLQGISELINTQAQSYEAIAEQLVVLAEQALASADNSFQVTTTLNNAASVYDDFANEAGTNTITYWRAVDVDASGRISAEVYGNGIVNDYVYHQGTGQLESIHSSLLVFDAVRHLEYQHDAYQNVTLRHDMVNDIREEFGYDRLDRLITSTVSSDLYNTTAGLNATQALTYDIYGNITHKSDVGDYTYGQNGAGFHAVTRAGNNTYTYDANGDMINGDGRAIQWSSFNKPTRITQQGRSATFSYGPDRARFKKVNHLGDTTLYLGLLEKIIKADGATEDRHYIYAAGQLVAEHIVSSTDGIQTRYLHKDALGSVDLITDAYANVVDRRSFDAWGKLRHFPWQAQAGVNDPLYLTQLPYTNKGYTGHESVQEVDLIHMNGRMYDATLARFISADPYIESAGNSQSYNRYSYVWNNPMKYTDPTGYLRSASQAAEPGIMAVVKSVINFFRNLGSSSRSRNSTNRRDESNSDRTRTGAAASETAVNANSSAELSSDESSPRLLDSENSYFRIVTFEEAEALIREGKFLSGANRDVENVVTGLADDFPFPVRIEDNDRNYTEFVLAYVNTARNPTGADPMLLAQTSNRHVLEPTDPPPLFVNPSRRERAQQLERSIGLAVIGPPVAVASTSFSLPKMGSRVVFAEGALTVRAVNTLRNSRFISSTRSLGKALVNEVRTNPYVAGTDFISGLANGTSGSSQSVSSAAGVVIRKTIVDPVIKNF
ncbi:hypothetical protein FKG94_06350 [Exilibacterium tricleocarpae]|uniref:Insecticide toxin TcdB middle/N-terminal domain-containing protein n=1 Tax=Exilibacterium tricleocarpae TaxID=2591008 RepID=A0A545U4A6_9GAMM|nr:FG-GAP-like repeat-containing protein [Exilibacterium tricleocarpae]TQV84274.1 hypothetical protein FKG94_06350 [Exilibacterium tricleocarpae]